MIYDDLQPNDILSEKDVKRVFKEHSVENTEQTAFFAKYHNRQDYRVYVIARFLGY